MLVVGLNHLHSPLDRRAAAAVPPAELAATLRGLKAQAGAEELVLLATCSRVELVAVAQSPERAAAVLRRWFGGRGGRAAAEELYEKRGADAVLHVVRVAAGLNSWIVGETEIQGQVKRAYLAALAAGTTGPLLNRVFQSALKAGKSIRLAAGTREGVRSIGGAAALVARRTLGAVSRGSVGVFGAGEAAESAARHLAAKGFGRLWVANRTLEKARAVARPLGAEALTLDEGLARLAEADAAVFSLACESPWLEAPALAPLIRRRRSPLLLLDLGAPRNLSPVCGLLTLVTLCDLDELQRQLRESLRARRAGLDAAETLAEGHARACLRELAKAEGLARP